ncbi:hypothetical protein [Actinoplanes derwentensis]|uniref:Uncharacterized protein n=1 Tax=Actinoplanes derwentensis TaxID=113562 RepID=A0A1H1PV36_9ACTN|nr:hypothetical protein [Actinoplanes derwentensis]GID88436.1 hypothetical protein Ade03nite_73600 [Actinoplanes derwentensis]SDS15015.1 hypothetical protein SAMN04489716_0124 [Actinoplanes derwentensis]
MTVKLSISVPDDIAAYLQSRGNTSAAVTDAVRRILPEARRERQRAAAQAYGEFLRNRSPEEIEADRQFIESNNDIALRGTEW